MKDILRGDNCTENLAGVSTSVYIGLKSDLIVDLTTTTNKDWEYNLASTSYKSGTKTGLFRIDGKTGAQKVAFSSLGPRKGYELTLTLVVESLDETFTQAARALNNNDIFLLVKDNDNILILYDPNFRVEIESGGLAGDTGAEATDDRQATIEFKLKPVKYPLLYAKLGVGDTLESLRTLSSSSSGGESSTTG